jgi:hypothetical protein
MDWTKSIASNLAASKEMFDYERSRMGMQGGMQASQIQQRQPDIVVNAPEQQQNPFAGMPAPTYNINNTYTSTYEAPQQQAQQPMPQFQAPQINLPQFQMPQMPAYQMPEMQPQQQQAPAPQQQAAAPAPEQQQQQAPPPPVQQYNGSLNANAGFNNNPTGNNWNPLKPIPW